MKPFQTIRRLSFPLSMLLILNSGIFAQTTKDTGHLDETKFIRVCDVPAALDTRGPQPCKSQFAPIEIATSQQLYSAVADAITSLHDGQYGFPADVVGASYNLPHAKWSFSPLPLKFRKVHLVAELQSAKQLGQTSKIAPSVVAIDLPGSGPQVYPADYVRSLFLTGLFPSRVRIVESWPKKGAKNNKILYILLEKSKADEAATSLRALAGAVSKAVPNEAELQAVAQRSPLVTPPNLVLASFPRADNPAPAGPENDCPSQGLAKGIAKWLPCLTVGHYAISMWISENNWRCGTWKKIVWAKDADHAVTDRLTNLNFDSADQKGCILEIDIHTPPHADNVFTSVTVGGNLQGQYACSPDLFGDKDQEGVIGEPCDNGSLTWSILGDALSSEKHPAGNSLHLQIAVPYFSSTISRPKILIGFSAEVRATFAWKLKSSCWCSPNECTKEQQALCAAHLVK